ncbi:MAG: ATP-binding protein [Deltaproteobacteria bacterium]|nr:ATP-binding protein [Deltaproteobacteria bacterium]
MVFMGGPRQVGKTTLALRFTRNKTGYLNWDIDEHRELILKRELPNSPIWIFDEIHKYRSWRNYLKGLYDKNKGQREMLVTGSAKLDYYRRGGDSLQGRYHYLRLHPLSTAELSVKSQNDFVNLMTLGGFPEPFFVGTEVDAKRWSREYRSRLIQDDLASLERIHDVGNLELLLIHLPELVGSPLSINALREDLHVSFKTVANWLEILERLYAIFRLSPFGAAKIRAVKKEQKHYHFDWTLIRDNGVKFENLVACHLIKWVHFREDTRGDDIELRYFRDIDGREVDFVIVENKKPVLAIECKYDDVSLHRGLIYFKERFPKCSCWQISAVGNKDYVNDLGIRVCPAIKFLPDLV